MDLQQLIDRGWTIREIEDRMDQIENCEVPRGPYRVSCGAGERFNVWSKNGIIVKSFDYSAEGCREAEKYRDELNAGKKP